MFDIGWGKLVIIGVVALIVIGPKELPAVLRTRRPVDGQDPPHGVGIPGPVPGGDARGRDGRPEEAGRRDDRRRQGLSTDFDPLAAVKKEVDSFAADPLGRHAAGDAPRRTRRSAGHARADVVGRADARNRRRCRVDAGGAAAAI